MSRCRWFAGSLFGLAVISGSRLIAAETPEIQTNLAPVVSASVIAERQATAAEETSLDTDEADRDTSADSQGPVRLTSFLSSDESVPDVGLSPCCDDLTCTAWLVEFDYLNWQAHERGLDFCVTEDGLAQTIGDGQVHSLQLDRDGGFRGAVGYQTPTGWRLTFRGTYFESSGSETVVRPGGVGELFATRSHPDTNEEADIANAFGDLEYRFFELEGSRALFRNRFADIRLFGAVVFADLAQSMHTQLDGRDFLDGAVDTRMAMDGFGFQFGSAAEWRMAHGFGLVGRVAAGLMHGRFDTNLSETNRSGQDLIVQIRDEYEQAVPKLDASGGVSWTRGGFQTVVGYDLTNFFQIINRTQFIDDIHEGLYGPFETDLLLEGMFVRVSATW